MTVNQHISRNTSLDRREHWHRRPEALGLSPGWYFTFHHMLHLALSVQSPQNMTHNISITHRIYSLRGTTGFTGACMLMLVNRCLSNSVVSGLARHAKRPCVWVLVETCFFTTSFTSLWCMIRYRLCEFFQRYCGCRIFLNILQKYLNCKIFSCNEMGFFHPWCHQFWKCWKL